MTVVDAQGRLFGRWNFVDVIVVVALLAIGPVGYAGFLLFRAQDPTLISIEPVEVMQGPNQRISIRGTNLRPYLRVSFDSFQGRTFLFQDSTRADIDLHDMPPGTYDVVLFDLGQERHRLPKALTVRENVSLSPAQDAVLAGRFVGLSKETVGTVRKGMPLPYPGEVLDIAPMRPSAPTIFVSGAAIVLPTPGSLEVPAVIKVSCFMKPSGGMPECGRSDFTLRPKFILTIPSTTNIGLSFQIDQIRSAEPVVDLTARVELVGPPQALQMAKAGDGEAEVLVNPFTMGTKIVTIAPSRPGRAGRDASVVIRAQRIPGGWWNGTSFVRVGGQFPFTNERYGLTAVVNSVDEPAKR